MARERAEMCLDHVYVSKWPHFVKLKFLDDFITAKQSVSNFKVKCSTIHDCKSLPLFY